jgi:hypothetical protein
MNTLELAVIEAARNNRDLAPDLMETVLALDAHNAGKDTPAPLRFFLVSVSYVKPAGIGYCSASLSIEGGGFPDKAALDAVRGKLANVAGAPVNNVVVLSVSEIGSHL